MKIRASGASFLLALAAVAAVLNSGCMMSKQELVAGGLYSVDEGDGSFRVVKILVLDDDAVHIAIYGNKFYARPTKIDPASLTFDSVKDEDEGIGMMHLPLSRETFMRDQPAFISRMPVTEEELEGYRMWEEAGGEVSP
jgi:hypothetical protein